MSEMKKIVLLIVNPNSRSGAEAELDSGIELLREHGFTVYDHISSSVKHTRELINNAKDKVDLVVLGGGDGTISSAAECLYKNKLSLAVLPLGTANDLARSIEISDDIQQAFRAIIAGKYCQIDLGCVNGHYFFNAAHIGLGVDITDELTPELKKRWGVFSYLQAFFIAVFRLRRFHVTLKIDNQPARRMRSIHLGIGNGRYYGGGNSVSDLCRINDGKLSLFNLKPQTVWELLILAPSIREGRQRKEKRIFATTGKRVEVTTSTPKKIKADGEFITKTPAVFEVIPRALSVISPLKKIGD